MLVVHSLSVQVVWVFSVHKDFCSSLDKEEALSALVALFDNVVTCFDFLVLEMLCQVSIVIIGAQSLLHQWNLIVNEHFQDFSLGCGPLIWCCLQSFDNLVYLSDCFGHVTC